MEKEFKEIIYMESTRNTKRQLDKKRIRKLKIDKKRGGKNKHTNRFNLNTSKAKKNKNKNKSK